MNTNTEQIIPGKDQLSACLKSLKLSGIHSSLHLTTQTAIRESWPYDRFLFALLQSEKQIREESHRKAQVRKAGFPQYKYLEDLDRKELPQDLALILPELESLEFIKNAQNVVLAGNPGTGKTHTAIGLGIKACLQGHSVLFTSVPHLLTQIRECQFEKKLHKLELQFEKYDLVVCDEFGYISFNKEGAEALFNHISLRAGRKATIITTNLSFDRWNEIFADPILASAMVDRLTHKAYLVNTNGTSYRLKETQKWMKKKAEPDEKTNKS